MSAPNTNIEKQESRHRGPLAGIAAAVFFAAIVAVIVIAIIPADADEDGVNPEMTTEQPATNG